MAKGQKRKTTTPSPSPRKKTSTVPQKGLEFFFESQRKKQHELEQEAFGDPLLTQPASPLGNRGNGADADFDLQLVAGDEEPLFLPKAKKEESPVQDTIDTSSSTSTVVTTNSTSQIKIEESISQPALTPSQDEKKELNCTVALVDASKPANDDSSMPKQPLTTDPLEFDAKSYPVTSWSTPDGIVAPYAFITEAFCIIAETSARIGITNVLCNMLRVLMIHTPADLLPAVWLCSNAIAAPYKGIELGIGPLILSKSITSVAGTNGKTLKTLYEKYGDWGDVAFSAKVSVRTLLQPKPLTVRGVYSTLKSIANLKGQGTIDAKAALVKKLVLAARGEEVRFLVRTFVSHLRIGAVRTTVLSALAKACTLDISPFCSVEDGDSLAAQFYRQPYDDKATITMKMKRAESLMRECYAQHPNLDDIVPAILQGLSHLKEHCPLTVGVPLRPMLGKITRDLSEVFVKLEGRSFACEYKYDGQRAQIHLDKQGKAKIFSRHLEDMTDKYPDVVAILPQICKSENQSFIIDAEIVAIDNNGNIQPFSTLSNRARKNVAIEDITINVCILAFDIMLLNDEPVLWESFRNRRQLLRDHFTPIKDRYDLVKSMDTVASQENQDGAPETTSELKAPNVANSVEYQDEVSEFFKQSIKDGCEGIMVKVLDHASGYSGNQLDPITANKTEMKQTRVNQLLASYEPDKRMESWLKVKKDYVEGVSDSLDLVPIGAWWGNGRKVGWYSPILLACYNPENETYESVCKCISGFSDKFYKDMLEFYSVENGRVLDAPRHDYITDHRPDVWFQSCEVWEIKGADITVSPIHKGAIGHIDEARGLSLRFPRFIRKRDDKDVEDATCSETLAEMYTKQTNLHGSSNTEANTGGVEEDDGWIGED